MMTWDQIDPGLVIVAVVQLGALFSAYYGLKAGNAEIVSMLKIAILKEQADRVSAVAVAKSELMMLIGKVESHVTELTHRVTTLESGTDEWTKALRQRTHELGNDFQTLLLRIDRLERPQKFPQKEPQ